MDGGQGNDYLLGEPGSNTYLFGRGSGQDIIIDRDKTVGNLDTIRLASDITPDDIPVLRNGDSLELSVNDTAEKLIVQDWFRDGRRENVSVESIG